MSVSKKSWSMVGVIVLSIVCRVVVHFLPNAEERARAKFEEDRRKFEQEVNDKLPIQVDEYTTLYKTQIYGKYAQNIRHNYKIDITKAIQSEVALFENDFAENVRQDFCVNADTLFSNKEHPRTYEFYYYDLEGKRVFYFTIRKDDCHIAT